MIFFELMPKMMPRRTYVVWLATPLTFVSELSVIMRLGVEIGCKVIGRDLLRA